MKLVNQVCEWFVNGLCLFVVAAAWLIPSLLRASHAMTSASGASGCLVDGGPVARGNAGHVVGFCRARAAKDDHMQHTDFFPSNSHEMIEMNRSSLMSQRGLGRHLEQSADSQGLMACCAALMQW